MIEVAGLTKSYGGFTAVDDVSFRCQPGRVTGFLGPNGAGKTTTMRVMAGLTPATHGTATIGGHHYRDIPNPGRHVGVLLDASAQHAGRTGREVLTLGARTMGLPESRVDEMLAMVSLSPTEAKRRVRNYSLGMRQRLGIAHALLGDPSVLILDEPANGLDPAGIRWMRDLLKQLRRPRRHRPAVQPPAQRGRADRRRDGGDRQRPDRRPGRQEVAAGDGLRRQRPRHLARQRGARRASCGSGASPSPPRARGSGSAAPPEEIGRAALAAGVVLTDLRTGAAGLEDLFLELTAATQRDDLTEGATGMTTDAHR